MLYKKKQDIWAVEYPPGTFRDAPKVLDRLKGREFRPIDDDPEEESSKGFAPFIDPYGKLDDHGIMAGTELAVVLRTDTRKIDKKGAKVKLDKEIRKSGEKWGRDRKKDRLEQISRELMRHAVPIPSFELLSFTSGPDGDFAFLPVANEKKMEAMVELLDDALGTHAVNTFPLGNDPERARELLTGLWLETERGHAENAFSPKSLADADSSMSSSSAEDLAFGWVNGHKPCASGCLEIGDFKVDLKAGSLNGVRIHLDLDSGGEKPAGVEEDVDKSAIEAETLGLQIGCIKDVCAAISRIVEEHGGLDVSGMDKAMRNMVKNVLRD